MKFYYLLFIIITLSACIKDKPQEPSRLAVNINAATKVFVINEGGFGYNNAGISIYDPTTGNVVENYYAEQNNNTVMGDVCQSVNKFNNQYYVVLNNSNKIIITNNNLEKTATISGFNSPRYILPVTYSKAYVSDLYTSSIQIVDLNTNSIVNSINCMAGTEEMALVYNKAFITNSNSNYCYVVNTIADVITDSINIGKGGASITIDKTSKIWILTGGNSSANQNGKLVKIDPVTLQIEQSLNFPSNENPTNLRINKTRDTLYYLNKGINRFIITDNQLPLIPMVNQGNKIYYGLGINPKDYTIYVSDAVDYVQKSKIEIYNTNGVYKASFNAGIISNGFVFE